MRILIASQIVLFMLCNIMQISAQDVLLLQVNYINPDGSLVQKDIQFEIEDDSKLYFRLNGERKSGYMDLKLQPLEKMATGIEITGYDVEAEHADFDQFGIVDMRHMDAAERKAALGIDYPLVVILGTEGDSESTKLLKAEIVSGEITKNRAKESNVTFQLIKDKSLTMELKGNKLNWLSDGSQFAFLNLEFKEEIHLKEQIFHYYNAEGLGYTHFAVVDLRNMDVAKRQEEYSSEAPILILLQKGEDDKGTQMDAEIIKGDLLVGKDGTDDVEEKREDVDKTITQLHTEMTLLFKDLENGFKETISWDEAYKRENYRVYPRKKGVESELGAYYSTGILEMNDNSFMIRAMNSDNDNASNREQIRKALSTYKDNSFKLTSLEAEGKHYIYLIEKSSRDIGFIEFRKGDNGAWVIILSSMIDSVKLKADILKKLNTLENNPNSLKGELLNEKENLFEPSAITYGADFGQLQYSTGSIILGSSYKIYPMSGLHYIVKELDINISDREKTIRADGKSDDGERGIFITYETDGDYMSVAVARVDGGTILQLTYWKRE